MNSQLAMEQLENGMWSNEKTIRIAERFKFFKRDQLKEETITIYLDELKKLVSTCEFSAYLEEALCDRFVCGIQDEIIQADLLTKRDLTLADAYQYALTMEVAGSTEEMKPFLKRLKVEEDEVSNIEDFGNCHYSLDIKEEPQPFEQEESEVQQEFVDLQSEPNLPIEDEWDQQDLEFGDHDSKKKFVCEFCQKALSSNLRLMDHRRSHTGEKPFSCTTCNKSFSRKENLRRHTQKQLGCDGFARETILQEYFGDHELEDNQLPKSLEKKTLQCQTCNQTFLKKTELEKHLKSHTEKGKSNEKINSLDHEDTKTKVLDSSTIDLDKTEPLEKQASVPKKKPNRIKSILCHICDYKTHANCRLELHLRKHTGERPYPCDMCSYKAVCKTNLNIHKRVHSTEKLLICEFCGYKTNYADKLQVHIRIHTGEKPFQCRFCDYKCADRKSLQNHERIHTGEKPYSCNFCDYRAAQRTGLVYHLKTHKKGKASVSKKRKKTKN